jgi:uncharacterized membrane protein YpjA
MIISRPCRAGTRAVCNVIWQFLRDVVHKPAWWGILLIVNFLGSLYGFWWYRGQFWETPVRYWLLVPDSPGSVFLMCIFLAGLLLGANPRRGWLNWLAAFAFLSNMKYGLWTAIVLPHNSMTTGIWTFDHIHLSLSHLGMWLQGAIFLIYIRPAVPAAVAALLWMWLQDFVDYVALGTHPTLPIGTAPHFAGAIAVLLSTAWGLWQIWLSWEARRRHAT